MTKYIKKTYFVDAQQFQWKEGSGPPDIPGVKFKSWTETNTAGGMKSAPVVSTAYVFTAHGSVSVLRGDWIIQDPSTPAVYSVCPDATFAAQFELAP